MTRLYLLVLILACLAYVPKVSLAQSPFFSNNSSRQTLSNPQAKNTFLFKIAMYQQRLKQKISALIREVKTDRNFLPLLLVILIAFGYGLIHAAGPGHGKVIAMSYIASRKPSLSNGLLLGMLIAFVHGLSGIVCVLGLRFLLERSISGNIDSVSKTTQIISFSLISILGLFILIKNLLELFYQGETEPDPNRLKSSNPDKKGLLPWAMAVGLVPCPGVVMIMLFCLSMDVFLLGVALAFSMSIGMAATISCVVIATILGKAGVLKALSQKYAERIETVMGILSGTAVSLLGILFLFSSICLSID
jgi:ABC-type nickel/cobalt efflux system permease component RcnA